MWGHEETTTNYGERVGESLIEVMMQWRGKYGELHFQWGKAPVQSHGSWKKRCHKWEQTLNFKEVVRFWRWGWGMGELRLGRPYQCKKIGNWLYKQQRCRDICEEGSIVVFVVFKDNAGSFEKGGLQWERERKWECVWKAIIICINKS